MNKVTTSSFFSEKIEPKLTVLLLLYFSDGLNSLGPFETLLAILSYLVIPLLILRIYKRFLYFTVRDIPLMLLIVAALVSVLWSDSPGSTLVNGRALLRITLFAIYFATRYNLKEQLKLVAVALGIAGVLSLLIGVAIPSTGISAAEWRGGFSNKNYLARTMVTAATAALLVAVADRKYRLLAQLGFMTAVALILLSQGKTALVQLIFLIIALLPLCHILRQHYKMRTIILVFLIPISLITGFWLISNFQTIAVEIFNKADSLAGRERLFVTLWKFFWEKPWFGYGYFGFWNSHYDEVYVEMSRGLFNTPWVPTHAHSGFLDTGLNLGFLGLGLFALSFIPAYFRAILGVISSRSAENLWPFLLLTLFLGTNINVNLTILSPTDLLWVLYVSVALSLAAEARRAKRFSHSRIQVYSDGISS